MPKIELCLTPELLDHYTTEDKIVVIVDILRATSIITTMFHNGLEKLIPAKSLGEAKKYKNEGFLVAAERDGKKVDFADFNNSPYTFTLDAVKGKTIVYSTTNGTDTINKVIGAEIVLIASFHNLSSVHDFLVSQQKDILILCSGWKGMYCIEDSLFAGALCEKLISNEKYSAICDSVISSLDLWNLAKGNISQYIMKIFQYNRLLKLGLEDIVNYCFKIDITKVLPIVKNNYIENFKK